MEIELAIYEDCLDLIDKFVECNNPTFKSFCQQWQDLKFQHIYAIQTTVIEVIQTTKTILHLAKRIVCAKDALGKLEYEHNDSQFLRRIGGMYLMYAIYFKQPTKQYVKILMSYETWQDFLTFIESLPMNVVSDEVRYIFWHMYKVDAFRFTALDYDVGLENLVDYDRIYNIHNGIKSDEVVRVKLKQKLTAIAETEKLLPDMVSLEEDYNKTKKSLVGNDKTDKALPSTNIFQDIQNALKTIRNIVDEKDSQSTSTSKNRSNYDQRRKELKRKAAGRCENATDDEESHIEDTSQQEETKKYFGRPTVRQLLMQKLPEKISDDLRNSSTDEEDSVEKQEQLESTNENNDVPIL